MFLVSLLFFSYILFQYINFYRTFIFRVLGKLMNAMTRIMSNTFVQTMPKKVRSKNETGKQPQKIQKKVTQF